VAALLSLTLTRLLVMAIDRWIPLNETSARRRHEFLGATGSAVYPINQTFGLVAVRDGRGELYQLPCRLDPETPEPVAKGGLVRLVGYNRQSKSFRVVPAVPVPVAGPVPAAAAPPEAPARR